LKVETCENSEIDAVSGKRVTRFLVGFVGSCSGYPIINRVTCHNPINSRVGFGLTRLYNRVSRVDPNPTRESELPTLSPAGTLGPKRGWLWRFTSTGMGMSMCMLICIFAPFLIQRILKSWWLWTYKNSTIKRASTRVVPWWVTYWKVCFREEEKMNNIIWLWWAVTPITALRQIFITWTI